MPRYLKKRLFDRINRKKTELDAARPLPKPALQKLREALIVEWTYNSNAIEGNSLTLRETQLVLKEGITIAGKSLREHFEATNHREAIEYVEKLINKKVITERDTMSIHALILKNIEQEWAGRYRVGQVRIVGASKIPPNYQKVPRLMAELVRWINANPERLSPVPHTALAHYRFVEIHPFYDGNGRTARLLMNLMLMRYGYPPIIVPFIERKRYYHTLEQANHGEYEPFINLMGQFVEDALDRYLDAIGKAEETLVPLSKLAPKTPYAAGYLGLLARRGELAATKRGKTWYASFKAVKEYQQSKI